MRPRRPWLAVVLVIALAGCLPAMTVDQRTTEGPRADQMFNYRVLAQSGHEPTFEEKRLWDAQLEQRISAYLEQHPDKANSLDVSTFRFLRQSQVGMDKEQILILLGPPDFVSADQAIMEKVARGYWSLIQGNATEVWGYPLGWNLYFAGQGLVDITQYAKDLLPPN